MAARRWVMRLVMMVVGGMMVLQGSRVGGQGAGKHGWDQSVCQKQPDNPGTQLPQLPNSFSMRVEANLLKQNKTTTLHEYFDYDANVAAVKQIENGIEEYAFYMYKTNQFLTVSPDYSGGTICVSQNLSSNDNSDIFGMKRINSTSDRVYSAYGALHFGGGINENFIGTETVRGIPCNKWRSCQYWPDMDATSNVIWYFSDKTKWTSVSGYSAPVRCHVTGRLYKNGVRKDYEHIYDFYDFMDDVSSGSANYFEVPEHTYCVGAQNTKPLPTMPASYSFDSEVLDISAKTVGFVREQYDNLTKLLRLDYRDAPNINSPFQTRLMTQIHDYSTGMAYVNSKKLERELDSTRSSEKKPPSSKSGVAYVIDVFRANCSAKLLLGQDFDNTVTANGTLRLRDPNEFMDLNHNYVYQGIRTIRGIECDSWAAERTDFPLASIKNPPSIWTWYFATADWLKKEGFRGYDIVLPVQLEIFSDNPLTPIHKHQSFYEYNVGEPDILSWDISSCYDIQHSRNFAFLVSGRVQDLANGNVKVFKYYMLTNLMVALGMSPLRFSNMDVQEAGQDTLVSFDMLDKAPLTGDVANVPKEPSLDTAYNSLNSAVNSGKLKFLLFSSLDKVTIKPVGPKYQELLSKRGASTSNKTITGGAMGGMAVGMLILGALIGFFIMFSVYKLKGGTFGAGGISMNRFDDDREGVMPNN